MEHWWIALAAGAVSFVLGILVAGVISRRIFWASKMTGMGLTELHQLPSWVVKAYGTYLTWCHVTICLSCKRHGHPFDFPPNSICVCGAKNSFYQKRIVSKVGYWCLDSKRWLLK